MKGGGTPGAAVVQPRLSRITLGATPDTPMAKPHRGLKKANHGARPANSKARKAKRKHIRT